MTWLEQEKATLERRCQDANARVTVLLDALEERQGDVSAGLMDSTSSEGAHDSLGHHYQDEWSRTHGASAGQGSDSGSELSESLREQVLGSFSATSTGGKANGRAGPIAGALHHQ